VQSDYCCSLIRGLFRWKETVNAFRDIILQHHSFETGPIQNLILVSIIDVVINGLLIHSFQFIKLYLINQGFFFYRKISSAKTSQPKTRISYLESTPFFLVDRLIFRLDFNTKISCAAGFDIRDLCRKCLDNTSFSQIALIK